MSGQDGIVTDNDCTITGDWNTCPANALFNFSGVEKLLTAQLSCPLDAVQQSDFRDASQQGLCQCDASIQDVNVTESSRILDCNCYICPDSDNQFGVAYECTSPIAGECHTFDCYGVCNGELTFIDDTTRSPTAAPVGGSSAFTFGPASSVTGTVMLLFTLVRMLH